MIMAQFFLLQKHSIVQAAITENINHSTLQCHFCHKYSQICFWSLFFCSVGLFLSFHICTLAFISSIFGTLIKQIWDLLNISSESYPFLLFTIFHTSPLSCCFLYSFFWTVSSSSLMLTSALSNVMFVTLK